MSDVLNLKSVKKVVIDEVDLMLDFGFKKQLQQIFQHLPSKKQHILFSATMTDLVEELIDEILITPVKEVISISGTPLENISQSSYEVKNFYTKVNLLNHLLRDREKFNKVLVFVDTKSTQTEFSNLLTSFRHSAYSAEKNRTTELNLLSSLRAAKNASLSPLT